MHHQMRVRQPAMDFLDHFHGEDVAVGLARELVGAMRGAHRDRQRVDLGGADEIDRLVRIGQQLVVADLAFDAVTVLLLAAAMFERAEHAEFTFDRGADPVRHLDHAAGDVDVVVIIRRGLGVGLERAVHHDGGKAVLERRGAGRFLVAMVLMHAERDLRIHLLQRVDHLRQHDVVGVGARAARGLDDDRRIDGCRRLHDRKPLLHIVDVEGRHAVAMLGGVVQQLPQRNSCHRSSSQFRWHVMDGSPRPSIAPGNASLPQRPPPR